MKFCEISWNFIDPLIQTKIPGSRDSSTDLNAKNLGLGIFLMQSSFSLFFVFSLLFWLLWEAFFSSPNIFVGILRQQWKMYLVWFNLVQINPKCLGGNKKRRLFEKYTIYFPISGQKCGFFAALPPVSALLMPQEGGEGRPPLSVPVKPWWVGILYNPYSQFNPSAQVLLGGYINVKHRNRLFPLYCLVSDRGCSGYDLDADTFSPDGRIFQVEYATKAVDNGGTAIGLCCSDKQACFDRVVAIFFWPSLSSVQPFGALGPPNSFMFFFG